MAKFILRLLVVIVLIAGITTAVYFIVNKPDESKKMYDSYVSLTKTEKYQNFDYLTKEWTQSGGTKTSLVAGNPKTKQHYNIANALKSQIEANLLLLNYAQSSDKTLQKQVMNKLKVYNEKAYGKFGVSYQAKYLYDYRVNNSDVSNIALFTNKLWVAMHDMEVAGYEAYVALSDYVKTYVFMGEKTNDAKYVLGDVYAVLVGAISDYENTGDTDNLSLNYSQFEKYVTKLDALIAKGEQDGYYSLNIKDFISAYNAVDKTLVCDLFKAEDKNAYINGLEVALQDNMRTINVFMEANNE